MWSLAPCDQLSWAVFLGKGLRRGLCPGEECHEEEEQHQAVLEGDPVSFSVRFTGIVRLAGLLLEFVVRGSDDADGYESQECQGYGDEERVMGLQEKGCVRAYEEGGEPFAGGPGVEDILDRSDGVVHGDFFQRVVRFCFGVREVFPEVLSAPACPCLMVGVDGYHAVRCTFVAFCPFGLSAIYCAKPGYGGVVQRVVEGKMVSGPWVGLGE